MLLELAGSQVLKSDLKPIVNVVDENDILAEVELKVFEYYNSVENIGKLLHDKKQQVIIFNKLAEIIDKYNFSIRDSYKQLWEIYIFNSLPISDPTLSLTINEKSIEEMASECSIIIYAWGTKGPDERQKEPEWLRKIMNRDVCVIGLSVKGVPKHPLQRSQYKHLIQDEPVLYRSKL
jgi:hypothetical protein